MKKLYRSRKNKVIAGVIGGIGEHMNVDPTILRVLYVFGTLVSGVFPGVLLYIIAALMIPLSPDVEYTVHESNDSPSA